MEYEYIFFFRCETGVEGFGYYADEEEATARMDEFAKSMKGTALKVEYGIACIEKTAKNYIADL